MKAYTLIEVLVAISILALLFAFGFISFRDFSRRQELIGTGRNIRADLRLAQGYALSGYKPSWCTGVLSGYSFAVSSGGYTLQAVCSSGFPSPTKSATFPSGITATTGSITFKVLGQGTNISSDLTFTLTQSGTNNQEDIVVTQGGEIK